jgi:tol-pal system protein YbgF
MQRPAMNNTSRTFAAAAVSALLVASSSMAQTMVTPAAPDPVAVGLVDRVDALEDQLRKTTAENERLQFELSKAQAEVARLTKALAAPPGSAPDAAGTGGLQAQAGSPEAGAAGGRLPPPPTDQPAGPAAGLGAVTESEMSAPPPVAAIDPSVQFKSAYKFVAQGDYPSAEKAMRAFLAANPTNPLAPEARYWLGQTLLAQGDNAGAGEQFLNVVQKSPRSAKAPDAYLYLGVAFQKMGHKDQACAVFRDVAVKFPTAAAQVKTRAALQARSCPA